MLNLYVTSSSRKCGKSFISAGLAATMQSLGYTTSVYKPIQTSGIVHNGFTQSPDLTHVKTIDPYINTHFTYLFKQKTEPLIASETENNPIEIELIQSEFKKISSSSECTIIDGDCGLFSPIAPNFVTGDLVKKLSLPVVIITVPDGNTINDTLMTAEYLKQKEIELRGVVINNIQHDCDKTLLTSITRVIEEYTDTKVLGLVESLGKNVVPQDLISAMLNGIDIESVFDVKIEKLDCL